MNCRAVLKKMCYTNTPSEEMEVEEPETAESAKSSKGYYMFLGDTVPSFYRRPHSSSDGAGGNLHEARFAEFRFSP